MLEEEYEAETREEQIRRWIRETKRLSKFIKAEEAKGVNTPELVEARHELEVIRQERRDNYFYYEGKGKRLAWLEDMQVKNQDGEVTGDEPKFVTDNYSSVERMLSEIDCETPKEARERHFRFLAFAAIVAIFAPHAFYTLCQIVQNGKDKRRTICAIMQSSGVSKRRRNVNMSETLKHC